MALAHDVSTRFPASGTATVVDTTTGDRTFSHAGSASAKGVIVTLYVTIGTGDGVTGITYGGVDLTKRQTASDTTEAGRVTVWTLPDDTACPTGTQDCVLQGATADAKVAYCSTVTAATTGTQYHAGNAVNTTTSTNPTVNVTTSVTTMLYGGVHGGASAPTSYAAGSGYTLNDTTGVDYGAKSGRGERSTSPVASGTVTFNFTFGTSDDWCIAAVAIEEFTLTPPPTPAIVPIMAPMIPN